MEINIKDLEDKRDDLRAQLSRVSKVLETETNAHKLHMESFQQEIRQLTELLQQSRKDKKEMEDRLRDLTSENPAQENNPDTSHTSCQQEVDYLTALNTDHEAQIVNYEAQIKNFWEHKLKIENDYAAFKANFDEHSRKAEKQIFQLEQVKGDLLRTLAAKEAQLTEAQQSNDDFAQKLASSESSKQRLISDREAEKSHLVVLEAQEESLRAIIQHLEGQVNTPSQSTALEEQIAQLEHGKEELSRILAATEVQLQEARQSNEDSSRKLIADREASAAQVAVLEVQEEALRSIIQHLGTKLKLSDESSAACPVTATDNTVLQATKDGLEKENEVLRKQLAELKRLVEEAEGKDQETSLDHTAKIKDMENDYKKNVADLMSKIEEKDSQIAKLQAQLTAAVEDKESISKQAGSYAAEVSQLESKLLEARDESSEKQAKFQAALNEKDDSVARLQQALQAAQEENSRKDAELQAALRDKNSSAAQVQEALEDRRKMHARVMETLRQKNEVQLQFECARQDVAKLQGELKQVKESLSTQEDCADGFQAHNTALELEVQELQGKVEACICGSKERAPSMVPSSAPQMSNPLDEFDPFHTPAYMLSAFMPTAPAFPPTSFTPTAPAFTPAPFTPTAPAFSPADYFPPTTPVAGSLTVEPQSASVPQKPELTPAVEPTAAKPVPSQPEQQSSAPAPAPASNTLNIPGLRLSNQVQSGKEQPTLDAAKPKTEKKEWVPKPIVSRHADPDYTYTGGHYEATPYISAAEVKRLETAPKKAEEKEWVPKPLLSRHADPDFSYAGGHYEPTPYISAAAIKGQGLQADKETAQQEPATPQQATPVPAPAQRKVPKADKPLYQPKGRQNGSASPQGPVALGTAASKHAPPAGTPTGPRAQATPALAASQWGPGVNIVGGYSRSPVAPASNNGLVPPQPATPSAAPASTESRPVNKPTGRWNRKKNDGSWGKKYRGNKQG
jgi:hypothetical protein